MATLIIDTKQELLRLSCGQCGDTVDLFFEIVDGRLHLDWDVETTKAIEDDPQHLRSVVHIVT